MVGLLGCGDLSIAMTMWGNASINVLNVIIGASELFPTIKHNIQ
jgi:hypothetical protein